MVERIEARFAQNAAHEIRLRKIADAQRDFIQPVRQVVRARAGAACAPHLVACVETMIDQMRPGEAFSAYGLRKGNLISCKARIELKAHAKGTGKVLAADRQTSVAVDIAEQTAAKTALQNVAGEVAERLLPKLVTK